MIKKSVLVLFLSVLVLSCIFAGSSSITVKASPYSSQDIKTDIEGHKSSYGFGAEAGYGYNIWRNLSVGADLKYSNYKYEDLHYHVISLLLDAGWTQPVSELFYLDADLKAGIQERIVGEAKALFFGFGLYAGAGCVFSERISMTVGLDLGFSFQKDSRDFSKDVMFGIKIGL